MSETIYKNLASVVVPEGVLPGAEFKIQFACVVKGEPSSKEKQLWRASGQVPVIVQRQCEPGSEKRHGMRPSEQVRAAGGAAKAIDSIQTIGFCIGNWATAQKRCLLRHARRTSAGCQGQLVVAGLCRLSQERLRVPTQSFLAPGRRRDRSCSRRSSRLNTATR